MQKMKMKKFLRGKHIRYRVWDKFASIYAVSSASFGAVYWMML